MKTRRTIEERVEVGRELNLEELEISGIKYLLKVKNLGDSLDLEFYENREIRGQSPDYRISICKGKVTFRRHVYRPSDDHDDNQDLFVGLMGKKVLSWDSTLPHDETYRKIFEIAFGSSTIDY